MDSQRLFDSFLARAAQGETVEFEEWLTQYPEQSLELRSLWHRHRGLESLIHCALPHRPATSTFFGFGGRKASEPRADARPGQILGDYRLLRQVGRGGMGQVWEAEQISLHRKVAVKLIRPDRISSRTIERFAREARAGGRLHHSSIVEIYAHGQTHDMVWIAMEFVPGSWTLREFLEQVVHDEAVPEGYYRKVARLIQQVARAVQVAHENGVIHRDIKPHNILITPGEEPKVTDFGLARITDESSLSSTGELAGTYYYMSPEQVTGRRIGLDHRTDIFSLGVVLYEMLAFQRPFEGDTSQQIAYQIIHKDPADLLGLRSRIPHDLALICGKCLEKDREHRYASMAEVAADVGRMLVDEPILARPPGPWRKARLWARRHPTWSVGMGLATAAFAAITSLYIQNLRVNRELWSANRNLEEEISAVERLSALQDYDDLIERVAGLWPAHPESIPHCEDWILDAERLVSELDVYRANRDALRMGARAEGETWLFSEDEEGRHARWWHANLSRLIESLEDLIDPATGLLSTERRAASREHGWSIHRRLRYARRCQAELERSGAWWGRWNEALVDMRRHSAYAGLELEIQTGLVPIGPDPKTGLWEFWHPATGREPERAANGELEVGADTGMVFVFLPPARFFMGAHAEDPSEANHDPDAQADEGPLHEVSLSAYFISKYEMTQGQWKEFTGWNPSYHGPDGQWYPGWLRSRGEASLRSPVDSISAEDCALWLARMGLELPTEAQWEHAARGGTTTPWWTGQEVASLEGAANLADRFALEHGASEWVGHEDWLDDGATFAAPVATYAANPFGLHEVHGNLWEWCRDCYDPEYYATSPELDPVSACDGGSGRVSRGGSFRLSAAYARSANRPGSSPTYSGYTIGVRPVLGLRSAP